MEMKKDTLYKSVNNKLVKLPNTAWLLALVDNIRILLYKMSRIPPDRDVPTRVIDIVI